MIGGNGRTSTPVRRHARLRTTLRTALQTAAGRLAHALRCALAVARVELKFHVAPRAGQALVEALARSLPATGARQLRRIARRHLVHRALTALEWAHDDPPAACRGPAVCVAIAGLEYVDEALQLGRGAVVYAPELGNVQTAFRAIAQRYLCLMVVAEAQAGQACARGPTPGIDRLGPCAVIQIGEPDDTWLKRIHRHLAKNGVVFMVSAAVPTGWRPAGGDLQGGFQAEEAVPEAAVRLALDDGVPLVPCLTWREGLCRHRLLFEPPRYLYDRYSVAQCSAATDELRRLVEAMILEAPEQWWGWG